MRQLDETQEQLKSEPDGQRSTTDSDARSLVSPPKGSGLVDYNVQAAVDAKHHLIVAHEVTNVGSDRTQLSNMARAAREAMGTKHLQAFADRGCFNGTEIKACEDAGITAFVPKPMTSNAKAEGRINKADFIYIAKDDEYQCPAGERAIYRFSTLEKGGLNVHLYWTSACPGCAMKAQCTTSSYRRIRRWEHEVVLERAQQRLDRKRRHDLATAHRGACVRHVEVLDGLDALPDENADACGHRDEPARAGLQPKAGDANSGDGANHEGDAACGGVSPLRLLYPLAAVWLRVKSAN